MVARVRSSDVRVFAAGCPVELAGLNDDAAERRAVAAEELRCGVNDDVSAVLDRTEQVRSSEGVVNYKRKAMAVCDFCNRVYIRKVAVRVAEGLKEDCSRVSLDGILNLFQVSRVNEGSGNIVKRKRVLQKVVGSAVDRLLRYDMTAVSGKCFNRVRDGCCTGSNCKCCAAAFKGCNSFFENALRRVGETAVNVTGICKTETVCCMFCIMEYVSCCLVNRNRSRIGSGVCLFLSYM